MHLVRDFPPRPRVLRRVQHRRVQPITPIQVDEDAFGYDEPCAISGSRGIVLDSGGSGFVVVDAPISRHGGHADAVAEGEGGAEGGWLEDMCWDWFGGGHGGFCMFLGRGK